VRRSRERRPPPLAVGLTRRLAVIAASAFGVTVAGFAAYYTSDPDYLLEAAVEQRMAALERALTLTATGEPVVDLDARALFERHPDAYGFALLDGAARVLDGANLHLVPSPALETGMFATDWMTRPAEAPKTVVASHRVGDAGRYLRLVFVARSDPANLVRGALLREFTEHALLPLGPAFLILLGANALMIRRSLRPLAAAAAWARAVRPGAAAAPLSTEGVAPEIADLASATQRAMQRLSEALEGERRRAAEAAHALRTPVAVLTARLDSLPDSPAATSLRADIAALARMVRQVLDATSAEMATVADNAAVDLAAVAEETVAALAPFGFEKGVELELEVDPGLEPAIGEARGIGLALGNLVENAILHGSGAVSVRAGPGPTLTVEDDGPGLPPGDRDRLFEPFRRGASAPPGGAGLGLAIVARVQRAHGGAVEAEDAPGGGARFRLSYRPACGGTPQTRQVGVRQAP
jgi:two-component system OmpR family sensor kinase